MARPIARWLGLSLGRPVVVDNRPGAGNIVGMQACAAAAPDGHTLAVTGMFSTVVQALHRHLPFDIVDGFEHIGTIGAGPQWLVAHPDAAFDSLEGLLAEARRAPGTIDYTSSGIGSTGHLLMELLQQATAVRLTHLPCQGGATALQAVLSGQVPVTVLPANIAVGHAQRGSLQPLAVSTSARSPLAPSVPTFSERGFPDLSLVSWAGLSAPHGTPRAVVQRLNASLQQALADPGIAERFSADGMLPMPSTPEQFTRLVREDTRRWSRLVARLGLAAG